jgi:hypothetical protein
MLENVYPDLGRKVLRTDHHPLFSGHGSHRGGVGGWNHNHRPKAGNQYVNRRQRSKDDVKSIQSNFQLAA